MSRHMDRIRRETQAKFGPAPTNPTEALAHALRVFAEYGPDVQLVTATSGIYDDAPWTGLTMGDLRALHAELTRLRAANAAGYCVCPECDVEQTTCTLCGASLEP